MACLRSSAPGNMDMGWPVAAEGWERVASKCGRSPAFSRAAYLFRC